jgi:hypothetical protein
MTTQPVSLNIRTYQVGFGDCFLLSFNFGADGEKHVLIDFGSTALTVGAPGTRMMDIANDVKARSGGKLTAVVATHRHKDHISGFATQPDGSGTGDVIAALKPDLVIQPWTEDPDLAIDATGPQATLQGPKGAAGLTRPQKQTRALGLMQQVAGHALREVARSAFLAEAGAGQLGFIGDDNLPNLSAVQNLKDMGPNRYVSFGDDCGLAGLLPGVKAHVLGPPTVDQSSAIKQEKSRDPHEFWQLAADTLSATPAAAPSAAPLFADFVAATAEPFPVESRWLIYQARAIRGQQLLGLVRNLDDAMNNTSVILLLEIGEKVLLFPGDAQIENWSYALSKTDTVEPLLTNVNLYKVGHHGSLNATPKTLWGLFKNKGDAANAQRLITLMSTRPGKHGSIANHTEVPRTPLVDALKAESTLVDTEDLTDGAFYFDTVVIP